MPDKKSWLGLFCFLFLSLMATELLYLKKALYEQEIAGVLDTVATNPLSNA